MRHQQVAILASDFQVFQVAEQHLLGRQQLMRPGLRRADAAGQLGTHLVQQAAQGQHQVGLGRNGDLHAAGVEMAVEHGVEQLAALAPVLGRHRLARELREALQEAVVAGQAGQALEDLQRRAGDGLQRLGAFARLLANAQREGRGAGGADLLQRGTAERGTAPVGRDVAVERTRDVGQHDGVQAEGLDDLAQLVDVAGREVAARQQRHLVGHHRQRFHQRFDDGGDGVFEAVFESTHVVGRGHVDDLGVGQLRVALARGDQVAVDVVTLGFGQAGGADGNHFWRGALADVEQRRLYVLVAPHDGGDLVHGRGLQRDRFLEVAHQQHQAERGAALRSVHHRHAGVQPQEGEARTQRLAHLERVDGAGFFGFDDAGHGCFPEGCVRRGLLRVRDPWPWPRPGSGGRSRYPSRWA